MKKNVIIVIISIFAISCTQTKPLYNWKGYDDAVYGYTKNSDEKSTERLVKVYEKLISNSGGTREVPPPGICADYGYLLIKKGETEKGKELLSKEIALYPESKVFIERIIKRLEK